MPSRRPATFSGNIRIDHLNASPAAPPAGTAKVRKTRREQRRRTRRNHRRLSHAWRRTKKVLAMTLVTVVGLLAVGYHTTTWEDGHAIYRGSARQQLIDATNAADGYETALDDLLADTMLDDPDGIIDAFNDAEALLGDVQHWDPPTEFRSYRAALTATVDATVAWLDHLARQARDGAMPVQNNPELAAQVAVQRSHAHEILAGLLEANDLTGHYQR